MKKIKLLKLIYKGLFLNKIEKKILKCLINKGILYPGDIIKDLKISHSNGIKKILNLRKKGYIIIEETSSKFTINPKIKKAINILI
jgi:DNA-binding MarR family transcriptional regulator